ncbi:MAG: hypothetical protein GEU90_12675 [Gemmatimonas sp.]|nr:hypothetical protein [Gemmatimonas sp.]
MRTNRVIVGIVVALSLSAGRAGAQENGSIAPMADTDGSEVLAPAPSTGGAHPVVRTAGAVLGSAAGYAIAESTAGGSPDDVLVPVAAGIVGGALGSALFTNAHPLEVLVGSVLAAVPAAALAAYVAESMPDERQRPIPLISFTIPHGLLTSAFAKRRTPAGENSGR